MTEHQFFSPKVQQLVTLVQKSPLFGEAYDTVTSAVLEAKMQALYQEFTPLLRDTLSCGMPDADDEVVDDLVKMIAPKVVVFCAMMAVEETDLDRLCSTALGFALLYWADHLLDQGDEEMDKAIQSWVTEEGVSPDFERPSAMARLVTLQRIDTILTQISLTDDSLWLRERSFKQFLYHSKALHDLCIIYTQIGSDVFWEKYTSIFVRHAVKSIQLPGTIAMIHALYRFNDPALSPLADLFADPYLMPVLETLGNMVLRVFDDAGDQAKDTAMGTLNLFTHTHPEMLMQLWEEAELTDHKPSRDVLQLWQSGVADIPTTVISYLSRLLQTRVEKAATFLPSKLDIFLILTKRFLLIASLVAVGDI
ncbi:MAG: hypothetical protein AAGF95_28275 [Chloroflexota bacterium]